MPGSKLTDRRFRQDTYYHRAKRENYAARSVYKLQEIDERFRLIKRGQFILDLGCRPGSWIKYAALQVGPKGFVVGLDREPLDIELPSNTRVLIGDVHQINPLELRAALPPGRTPLFHLVLSDMAPDTSGIPFTDQVRSVELFTRALDISIALGLPGGHFVGKIFMGDGFSETLKKVRQYYGATKTVKPDATRKSSTEIYIVATDRKKVAQAEPLGEVPQVGD